MHRFLTHDKPRILVSSKNVFNVSILKHSINFNSSVKTPIPSLFSLLMKQERNFSLLTTQRNTCKVEPLNAIDLVNQRRYKFQTFHSNSLVGAAHLDDSNIVLFDSLSSTYKPLRIQNTIQNDTIQNNTKRDLLNTKTKNISQEDTEMITNESIQYKTKQNLKKGLAWYTCGPTVYDSAHLGHARTYVCIDILHRLILHHYESISSSSSLPPSPPLFIMNITDVDDKILKRAKEKQIPPLALARYYEREFIQDLKALNVKLPTVITRVSEHVESDIIPYISKIIDNGMAYVLKRSQPVGNKMNSEENDTIEEEEGIYFDVTAFEKVQKYGKLASSTQSSAPSTPPTSSETFHEKLSSLPNSEQLLEKKDKRDFALWKIRKQNEELYWNSPWGEGRPGWHIECSAMIESIMNKFETSHKLQVHAGGIDLKFPHHTNEIAQAEAYHYDENNTTLENEWIPHWVHTGHLHIEGLKMSKSLKNFITIRQMLQLEDNDNEINETTNSLFTSPADDFRLWCLGLSGSYRGTANYSETRLLEARSIREKIVQFLIDGNNWLRVQNDLTDSHGNTCGPSSRIWRDEDYSFYQSVCIHSNNSKTALLGNIESQKNNQENFDLDGSTFVKEIMDIIQLSNSYLRSLEREQVPVSMEPMQFVISTVQQLLSLVGFSNKTTQPFANIDSDGNQITYKTHIQGGEAALVEKSVQMRKLIRDLAIHGMKNSNDQQMYQNCLKDILNICDQMRDETFPMMGIEVFDNKSMIEENEKNRNWRWCKPNETKITNSNSTIPSHSTHTKINDVKDLFRVGKYKGMFLDFDHETGLPLTNIDGSDISKKMRKKLVKKRDKFLQKMRKEHFVQE